MLLDYLHRGGPLMVGVLGCWVVVLTLILDRGLYWLGVAFRHPLRVIHHDLNHRNIDRELASLRAEEEVAESARNLHRLGAVSQLATSVGLFGTVVGICQTFLSRDAGVAVSQALASGLSTALFTTVFGLVVFLFGQTGLLVLQGWTDGLERSARKMLGAAKRRP